MTDQANKELSVEQLDRVSGGRDVQIGPITIWATDKGYGVDIGGVIGFGGNRYGDLCGYVGSSSGCVLGGA